MADYTADVVVWGGTTGGVLAAKAAIDNLPPGGTVRLINCYWHGGTGLHIGGMSTGGLQQFDFGTTPKAEIIGGYGRQLLESMDVVFNKAPGTLMTNPLPANFLGALTTLRTTSGITTTFTKALGSVTKVDGKITKITAVGGDTWTASVFIDASYEGDLMALAGVTCSIGREAADTTGELQEMANEVDFDRWYIPGFEGQLSAGTTSILDTNGQRTPNTSPLPKASRRMGDADSTLQSVNFRLCLTKTVAKKVAFTAPAGYQAAHYRALQLYLAANPQIVKFQALAGSTDNLLEGTLLATNTGDETYDVNSPGTVGTDVNGHLWLDAGLYPFQSIQRSFIEANYLQRVSMMTAVYKWIAGLVYFVANDVSLAGSALQTDAQLYGYTNTQFSGASNYFGQQYFPPVMYLREGRRMVGQYVMSVKDVMSGATKPDPVCKFNYRLDHHPAVRHASGTNYTQQATEGSIQANASPAQPYQIPWRALLPVQGQADNLIVSTCISCTHVAWGSLRLEPSIWMQGEAAGTAAALCVANGITPQTLPYEDLEAALKENGAQLYI